MSYMNYGTGYNLLHRLHTTHPLYKHKFPLFQCPASLLPICMLSIHLVDQFRTLRKLNHRRLLLHSLQEFLCWVADKYKRMELCQIVRHFPSIRCRHFHLTQHYSPRSSRDTIFRNFALHTPRYSRTQNRLYTHPFHSKLMDKHECFHHTGDPLQGSILPLLLQIQLV